ncbi:MAG: hypothetical protein FWG10_05390 [Eubacteriaceae bacterium]|nr:hypothetical protein [Eubacteriaceae bacterium]
MKPEKGSSSAKDFAYLLEMPKVKEILDTIGFARQEANESVWETEPINKKNFSVTLTDGWVFYTDCVESVKVRKEGMSTSIHSNNGAGEIGVSAWALNTTKDWLQKILDSKIDTGQKQIGNIRIYGREFLVVKHEKPLSESYALITSTGTEYNAEAKTS